jgi:hypothetical protein
LPAQRLIALLSVKVEGESPLSIESLASLVVSTTLLHLARRAAPHPISQFAFEPDTPDLLVSSDSGDGDTQAREQKAAAAEKARIVAAGKDLKATSTTARPLDVKLSSLVLDIGRSLEDVYHLHYGSVNLEDGGFGSRASSKAAKSRRKAKEADGISVMLESLEQRSVIVGDLLTVALNTWDLAG